MSLVSDALRKARRERAERQAREQGVAPPTTQTPSGGVRFGVRLILSVGLALAAGLAGGVVAWWLLAPEAADRSVAAEMTTPEATSASASMAADIASTSGTKAEPSKAGSKPESSVPSLTTQPVSTPAPTLEPQPERDTAAILPVEEESVESLPQEAPVPEPEPPKPEPRDVVAEATIGEAHLTLGYIVYRETDPFAEINGMTSFVGTEIEGFRLDEIHRDRVVLSDENGPLVIRVR